MKKKRSEVERVVEKIKRGARLFEWYWGRVELDALARWHMREVRRARRETRVARCAGGNLLGLIDAFDEMNNHDFTDEPEDRAVIEHARVVLAPRRRGGAR